jgi:hypothetical protein
MIFDPYGRVKDGTKPLTILGQRLCDAGFTLEQLQAIEEADKDLCSECHDKDTSNHSCYCWE